MSTSTIVGYYFTSVITDTIFKRQKVTCQQKYGENGSAVYYWQQCKIVVTMKNSVKVAPKIKSVTNM